MKVSFVLGAVAAAASVTVMIPMDTIKTRLVIQVNAIIIETFIHITALYCTVLYCTVIYCAALHCNVT